MPSKEKILRTNEEWQCLLSPDQYRVTREHGTERPFTGPHLSEKRAGTYHCIACSEPLFRSETKFESGSGWPSFFAPFEQEALNAVEDHSHSMRRVEIRCTVCDSHLGHVFNDGPAPTGLRYCINGLALDFKPDTE